MERTENTKEDFYNREYIEQRTKEAIKAYLADEDNETNGRASDLTEIQFKGMLSSVGREVFGRCGAMLEGGAKYSGSYYDLRVAVVAVGVYLDLCGKYDKIASLEGFANYSTITSGVLRQWVQETKNERIQGREALYNYMEYISHNTITYNNNITPDDWKRRGEVLTMAKLFICSNLRSMREAGLEDKLINSKQAVGVLSVANHAFGWNAEQVAQEERARALAIADLPKFMLTDAKTAPTEEAPESL